MSNYVSYYTFFSDNLKLIKDIKADFQAEKLSGAVFDKRYSTFLNKLISRCRTFSGETLLGSSKVVKNYITDIGNTVAYTKQGERFDKLIQITEHFMRSSM